MFKRSTNSQGDIFKNISGQLSGRKQKVLDSDVEWHNIFYSEIVSQIDEQLFSELFHDRMGRPNASVRVLIGMMILKEGQGWSDEQLFDECRFNLRMMRALGLSNIDDEVPSESTYYEFRRLLGDYFKEQGRDLLKESFVKITTTQVTNHGVSGKKIRLDSKLINSNIARSNRLNLIVEGVRKYVSGLNLENMRTHFDDQPYELLLSLQHKSTSNITYPLNAQQKREMLVEMGEQIRTLLELGKGTESANFELLARIYEEQYEQLIQDKSKDGEDRGKHVAPSQDAIDVEVSEDSNNEIVPKDPKQIPSSSVQSVHDPEATYRSKGQGSSKQTVAGFHANVTESCDPQEDVHLVLDVEVVPANVCEDAFLMDAVKTSQQIIEQGSDAEDAGIEEVITDGGYDSIANREKMLDDQNPTWSMAKMKGGRRVYHMDYNNSGKLEVKDAESGEPLEVEYSERAEKFIIHSPGGTKRYMRSKDIENYIGRQQIESQANQENYNLRATVESTIHQTFHRLKKSNKMVYRGLYKCQMYVLSRAFWVNIVRITDKSQRNLNNAAFYLISTIRHTLKCFIFIWSPKMRHRILFCNNYVLY